MLQTWKAPHWVVDALVVRVSCARQFTLQTQKATQLVSLLAISPRVVEEQLTCAL